jgi:mannose-6-phosphate isomerase
MTRPKVNIPDILVLKPNRVWRTYPGGRTLDEIEGKPEPADDHFPEDWIASTTRAVNKGREHIEDEGFSKAEIDGQEYYLKDLFEQYPEELVGRDHYEKYGPNTQFLLKFLDSAVRLHIQAHPTIEFAKKHLNSDSGKTEAYVILGIREEVDDPYIYLGFQRPLPKEDFKKAVMDQDSEKILSCFDKISVKPGDVFLVPGGLPHAIGEGVFMIEIMEPTDLVVRFEFERGGYRLPEQSRFMGRDVDFALSMLDFNAVSEEEVRKRYFCEPKAIATQGESSETGLIGASITSCFRVNRLHVKGEFRKKENSFYVGIVTRGSGKISSENQDAVLTKGSRFIIPFSAVETSFSSDDKMEIIIALPPGI